MHYTKNELYERIKDLKTRTAFEKEIQQRKKEYDELFDEETLALLIVDELGRNTEGILKIRDLLPGVECTVFGKVTWVNIPRTFQRKNGSTGKVANLEISDETGRIAAVLWGKHVELVENKTIQSDTSLKLVNGYVKKGYQNLEIHMGRWSTIELLRKDEDIPPSIKQMRTNPAVNIYGVLQEIQPTTVFFKEDGSYGFVTKITIQTDAGLKHLTLWDEQVKTIQQFTIGDTISIKNIDTRKKNGTYELHVNGYSTIEKC